MVKIPKKIKVIKEIKKFIINNNLDGYLIPKNDNYFTEYSNINNLEKVSKFTGSAGFALILRKVNYLFVDGRYTIQAKKQSGKKFKIFEIPFIFPKDLISIKNFKIGFDAKLFTQVTLERYFEGNVNLIPCSFVFRNKNKKKFNNIYHLNKSITGQGILSKINEVKKYMKNFKINYFYLSASENINWLLNIRGKDLPNSPLTNCKLILSDSGKIYLFINLHKVSKIMMRYFKKFNLCEEGTLFKVIKNFKSGYFGVDKNTCSIFERGIINSQFKIIHDVDPIYDLKSVKNSIEIKNTLKAHIEDGVAITKFLYWFKNNKKKMTEKIIENKLEKLRRKSKNYLYPSFDTIAGSGPNGAIIHYKSTPQTNRKINKNDILLIDSGGQYKWGTTDITRTTCLGVVNDKIKSNFTRVLKGHIAVISCDLNKKFNGKLIDNLARKPLKSVGLDYSHGTGHGVGFFLNVHEGPQAISKYNKIKLKKGMILSNEPGFYKKNMYGIRIENLIYVDQVKNKLLFKNLTFAPIDFDLINFKLLNKNERNYLFNYHLNIYSKLSKYLTELERRWLISLIK